MERLEAPLRPGSGEERRGEEKVGAQASQPSQRGS